VAQHLRNAVRGPVRRAASDHVVDVVVGAAVLVLFYVIVRVGHGATLSFTPRQVRTIDAASANLPYYAARSLLRMFVALGASTVFTLGYGYAAARSRRAEKVLIPLLDILQSVPVLGFLSVTITGFMALFPGSYLGLELASVFAIFTSMVWNMTFSFYHSLLTQPREFDELARSLRLTRWGRFWRVDVPSGAIGLVWNGMMSFGGAWFFLAASEAISVLNRRYALPGVGSYAAAAISAGDLGKVGIAIATMVVMVVSVNVVFWRPLTAWAERFKVEQAEAAEVQRSVVLDLLRRSRWPRALGRGRRRIGERLGRTMSVLGRDHAHLVADDRRRRLGDTVLSAATIAVLAYGLYRLFRYTADTVGLGVYATALWLGFVTFVRVLVLVGASTLVWVPVGVWIGLSPRLARIAQPIVQILASFPANLLFPFATALFIAWGISLNVGGILLMSLGAQWYILFNTIAGAMAIPTDLREAMDDLGVRGWERWRRLIIPAIFPAYVTGAITASGGAWNASIVAEVVTYGGTTLTATGLGAFIARATESGDVARILAGVAVMSLYVVGLNRLVWRRLYRMAEVRFALG
jgi:NitT/TauT family transport system permease protein